MNFLFLMDPLETVITHKDTSFALMFAAHTAGHKVFYLPHGGISLKNGKLSFNVISVVPHRSEESPFTGHKKAVLGQGDVDAVFIRSDPPFDQEYLMHTWLLDRLPESIPVINNPSGIRTANEKLWATQFEGLIPNTLVSGNRSDILEFLDEEKDIIAKPTDSFGGSAVFLIHKGDKNTNVILETLTSQWEKEIILQQYLPDAQNGDKRILLLNGEPLGAVLRVHASDDHRNNFFAGGKPVAADINSRDIEIIEVLKPELQKLGLYFVGIDVIGGKLIEVNVTSPTCLQEISQLNNENLDEKVISFVENLVDQAKTHDTII